MFGGRHARIAMVERYWLGIHKIAGTTETTSIDTANEPRANEKESIVHDFSKLDFGDTADQLRVPVYGASDQAVQHPSSDMSHSWNGLDLSAEPVLPTAKEGGGAAQAGSAPR
jgi:hypothetical protein